MSNSAQDNKRLHLEMIQLIITRMGANSFFMKGWTVTLVASIFILTSTHFTWAVSLTALLPVILFALIDANFLSLERSYRKLYDEVRLRDPDEIVSISRLPEKVELVRRTLFQPWPRGRFNSSTLRLRASC